MSLHYKVVDGIKLVGICTLHDFLLESPKYNNEQSRLEATWRRAEAAMRGALKKAHYEERGKEYFYGIPSEDYALECVMVLAWLEDNQAVLYERCKEDFFEWRAIELAEESGCSTVVLSNLS